MGSSADRNLALMSGRKRPLLVVVTIVATFTAMTTGWDPSAMASQPDIDSTWHSGVAFPLDVQGYGTPVAQVVDTDGSTFIAGIGYPHQFPVALVTKLDPAGNLDPSLAVGRSISPDSQVSARSGSGWSAGLRYNLVVAWS